MKRVLSYLHIKQVVAALITFSLVLSPVVSSLAMGVTPASANEIAAVEKGAEVSSPVSASGVEAPVQDEPGFDDVSYNGNPTSADNPVQGSPVDKGTFTDGEPDNDVDNDADSESDAVLPEQEQEKPVFYSLAVPRAAETFVKVSITAQANGNFLSAPQIGVSVSSQEAEKFGYKDSVTSGVSVFDAMVKLHEIMYGSAFTANTAPNYLDPGTGFVNKLFGIKTSLNGFLHNGGYPGGKNGATVLTQSVVDGDTVDFFLYQDTECWTDTISWFTQDGRYVSSVKANGVNPIELGVEGCLFMAGYAFENPAQMHDAGDPVSRASFGWVNTSTGKITPVSGVRTNDNGAAEVPSPSNEGTYYLTTFLAASDIDIDDEAYPLIMTLLKVTVDKSYVPPKDKCALSSLEVADFNSNPNALAVSPAFNSDVFGYKLAKPLPYQSAAYMRMFYVRATSANAKATITASLNGCTPITLTSGAAWNKGMFSGSNALKPGHNVLEVTVSAPRGAVTETVKYSMRIYMEDPSAKETPPSKDDVQAALDKAGNTLATTVTNPTYGAIGGEWSVFGVMRSGRGVTDEYIQTYADSVARELVTNNGVLGSNTASEYSRVVLALTSAGYNVEDFAGHNLLEPLGDMSLVCKQGVNGPVWALIALDSHGYDVSLKERARAIRTVRDALVDEILGAQLSDGGWDITNKSLDPDMTAMALIALAPYKADAGVAAAITKATNGLSKALTEVYGTHDLNTLSPESCAQVIMALTTLGINPATDTRFISAGTSCIGQLNKYALSSGGYSKTFGGKIDVMSTEQANLALETYMRYLAGKPGLFNMADISTNKTWTPGPNWYKNTAQSLSPAQSKALTKSLGGALEDLQATDSDKLKSKAETNPLAKTANEPSLATPVDEEGNANISRAVLIGFGVLLVGGGVIGAVYSASNILRARKK